MELTTSWKEEGLAEGLRQGLQQGREAALQLVVKLLRRRLGAAHPATEERVRSLSPEALEAFAEALLGFGSVGEAEEWLRSRAGGTP
jgi:flagellar biosynthesis/type III secretory pathway protein FliH